MRTQPARRWNTRDRLGADSAEVSANAHYGLNVNVRLGEVETLEHSRDRGLGVSVYIGNSKGHASSGDLRNESIRDCVEKAVDIARFTQADKCNGLAPDDRLAHEFPDLDLWHPQALDAELAMERALACEAAGLDFDGISNSDGASASAGFGLNVYANSTGFSGRRDGTRFGQSCVLIAGEGETMQRDYWYDSRRAFADLEDVAFTGQGGCPPHIQSSRRPAGTDLRGAGIICTGNSLWNHWSPGRCHFGGLLYRNSSFLRTWPARQLFPEWMQISERPHIPRAPSSVCIRCRGRGTSGPRDSLTTES